MSKHDTRALLPEIEFLGAMFERDPMQVYDPRGRSIGIKGSSGPLGTHVLDAQGKHIGAKPTRARSRPSVPSRRKVAASKASGRGPSKRKVKK